MSAERRLGPFVFLELLGEGAMGSVYKARDERTGGLVALKLLRVVDPDFLERFRREAALAAKLRHPNITTVVDHGIEGGVPFLALELVTGGSLGARLRKGGRLDGREAVAIVREIALALGAIHAAGLVHRDLKPDNVLLTHRGAEDGDDGHVKVSDFGLVRRTGASSDLTRTGEVVGTPIYMAPEQARGDKTIDARADIYALGAVLYELLTGEPPFKGDAMGILMAKLTDSPALSTAAARTLAPPLVAVVLRCLARDPGDRPQSAEELVQELDAAVASSRGVSPAIKLLVGVATLSLLATLGLVATVRGPEPAPSPTPRPTASSSPKRPSPASPTPPPSLAPTPPPHAPAFVPISLPVVADEPAKKALELLEAKDWRGALDVARAAFAQASSRDDVPVDLFWVRLWAQRALGLAVDEPTPADRTEAASFAARAQAAPIGDKAIDLVEKRVRREWTAPESWLAYAVIANAADSYLVASANAERAALLAPESFYARRVAGQSIVELVQALELAPINESLRARRDELYRYALAVLEGALALESAKRAESESPLAYLWIGEAHKGLGEKREAVAAFETFLDLGAEAWPAEKRQAETSLAELRGR